MDTMLTILQDSSITDLMPKNFHLARFPISPEPPIAADDTRHPGNKSKTIDVITDKSNEAFPLFRTNQVFAAL